MSIARHHAEWLSLVEVSGPFLSMPVLLRVFPQGLDAHDPDHAHLLRSAHEEWQENPADPALHRAWLRFVLTRTLELPEEALAEAQAVPQGLHLPAGEHGEGLRPDLALMDGDKPALLIHTYPAGQGLERPLADRRWKASPATRMMELLHGTGCRLGLVTNGEHWMLVDAPRNETTGYASWYASLWPEEPLTLRAFRTLLGARRFFSVPEDETLAALLAESASHQQEVTDQLGYQVRKAVEVLVHSLDRADQDHDRKLLGGVPDERLYEASLGVMMRLVFLFAAEERGLLLLGDPLYDQHYAVSTLRAQLREAADQLGEEVLERRHDAWARLLATFRAVHAGVRHERLRLPAYGGHLFDPDRYPFLEGRPPDTNWNEEPARPLPVNNRTVLHLLEALQLLQVKVPGGGPAEARRVSFRALDIEQIGHVYEGLLDHTARRADGPMLGLTGSKDHEPEVSLAELERLWPAGGGGAPPRALLKFLRERTGRSESALGKALAAEPDAHEAGRFRAACGHDESLWGRVRRFAGLVRPDTFGYPVVVLPGSVYVTQGTDRRSSGTHYTPRSLTEPIVQYTLEPVVYDGPAEGLPREQWRLRSARQLLGLKVCDPATGSGAFLVQACRYLAERLQEAWEEAEAHAAPARQGDLPFGATSSPTSRSGRQVPRITPFGEPSEGGLYEELIPVEPEARQVYALRVVAQRCLYGVDKNPLAVEMAKLSLWLLTLAKDQPFTFLDHTIRHGDSLTGIHNLRQLRWFNLSGERDLSRLHLDSVAAEIDESVALRRQIAEMSASRVEDVQRQEALLHQAQEKTERLRIAADLLVAEELTGDLEPYVTLANHFRDGDLDGFRREAERFLAGHRPFHWPLEFPEVFSGRGGFDALVSNPPFMGGQKITGNLGEPYREFLVRRLARGQRGSADLCAYFFLRARQLLREGGGLGMLATNTIAQGDTREVGLDQLLADGCVIPRAVPSRKWPGTASLEVAHLWLRRGAWAGPCSLDDEPAEGITAFLTRPGAVTGKPHRLTANAGKSFQGSIVLGMGFVLTPEEAEGLIARDGRNKDVLFPYLNGEDLNSRPDQSPSRWVIDFFDWPLDRESAPEGYTGPVAADYPNCLAIVEEKVRPVRAKNKRKPRRELWWQYAERAPALYATIAGMEWVLTVAATSRTLAFAFTATDVVFSHATYVIALSRWEHFALLQSAFHDAWARHYASSMKGDLRYTPSDCFETFPFPTDIGPLEASGESYHAHRRQVMLARNEGLTKTYNRFHDPGEKAEDIAELRRLHVEMDRAVAGAYGWGDLDLGHGFHETRQGVRYTLAEAARLEVLGRLLALNHERYAEEERQGLHEKKRTGRAKSR
jgi:hypothetical protein